MSILGNKTIQLTEITSSSARKKGAHLKASTTSSYPAEFKVTSGRLSVAMARTILSPDPSSFNLFIHVIGSLISLQSMVHHRSNQFSLVDGYRMMYRDFSSSTRTGEIAQGISYLFAQDILDFPCVVDFNGYLASQKLPLLAKRNSAPDFAIYRYNSNKITLLESKGSCPDKERGGGLKTALRESLEQCDSGINYFTTRKLKSPVASSFGSAIWFSENQDNWDTRLYFADPEAVEEGEVEDPISLIRYHYATWFALLGYYGVVTELVNGNPITMPVPEQVISIGEENYYILDRYPYFSYPYRYFALLDEFGLRIKAFAISTKVWEILSTQQEYKVGNLRFTSVSEENMELFSDGTLIIYH